jgi:hypothetical protein
MKFLVGCARHKPTITQISSALRHVAVHILPLVQHTHHAQRIVRNAKPDDVRPDNLPAQTRRDIISGGAGQVATRKCLHPVTQIVNILCSFVTAPMLDRILVNATHVSLGIR